MGFKKNKAPKNKYLRHQFFKKIKGSKKNHVPALVQCFGPFMQFSNLVVFESPGPSVLSLGPLVPWSFSPLVLWSLGPLVPWSSGPLVLWSSGPLVLPSFGGSGALKHFEDNP